MEMDLESSRSQIEQISNISRASETALEKVSEAYEEYKKSTEVTLVEKEVSSFIYSWSSLISIVFSPPWSVSEINYVPWNLSCRLRVLDSMN